MLRCLDHENHGAAQRRAAGAGQTGSARRGETLTALIEQGLRLVLAAHPRRRRKRVVLPVSRARGGVFPGVDLNDSAVLLDIMEART